MTNRFEVVNAVLEEGLDLPSGERESFIAARCGADRDLFAAVSRLLAMPDSAGFLDAAATVSEIGPGDILGGRFRILETLGTGGAATVYRAEDLHLGEIALKVLDAEMRTVGAMERFAAEIRLARSVRHPNIRAVFDLFVLEGRRGGPIAAATMQYLRGETLASRLRRKALSCDAAINMANGIAGGIDALHKQGIVHGDLKPGNIMVTAGADGSEVPVIVDFGLARRSGAGDSENGSGSRCGEISGSPDYMAPEQFRSGVLTEAVDIYAFGLVLFEMIAGVRPFPAEDLVPSIVRRITEPAADLWTVAPWAPRQWAGAIGRALARDPAKRPASAAELLADMQREPLRMYGRCSHGRPRRLAGGGRR
jgi:eukaryotic-like serine/threonine-protein kinase